MPHYELTYIVSAAIAETEYPMIQQKISQLITSLAQGKITSDNILGRKKLAYPINKEKYGHYVAVEFDADPSGIQELDRQLKLDKSLLRHLLISKQLLSPEQLAEQEAGQAKIRAKRQSKQVIVEKKEKISKKKATAKPIDLDKLDEKLEEILSQDIK